MRGVITKRDVIENLGLIWREFGPRCLIRCLSAVLTGRSTTFLELSIHGGSSNLENNEFSKTSRAFHRLSIARALHLLA